MEARSRRKIKERKRITTDEKIYTKERSNKVKRKECKADERKKIYMKQMKHPQNIFPYKKTAARTHSAQHTHTQH